MLVAIAVNPCALEIGHDRCSNAQSVSIGVIIADIERVTIAVMRTLLKNLAHGFRSLGDPLGVLRVCDHDIDATTTRWALGMGWSGECCNEGFEVVHGRTPFGFC